MNSQRGEPSKELKNLKDVQAFMDKDDVTLVGFFNSDKDFAYVRFIEAGEIFFSNTVKSVF